MRKQLFILPLAVVFLLVSYNQGFSQSINLHGGLNFAKLNEDIPFRSREDENTFRKGANFGVTFEYPLIKALSIESGILYNTRGNTFQITGTNIIGRFSTNDLTRINYWDIPITVNPTLSFSDNFSIQIIAGGYFAFAADGEMDYENTSGGNLNTIKRDLRFGNSRNDDFKNNDRGLIIGSGIIVGPIIARFHYFHGLLNITPDALSDDITIYNRLIRLSIGCKINF